MPAFDLQRMLRIRILGVKYWEAESQRRRVYFSGYDAGAQESWESLKKILEIKHQARVEEEERNRNLKEMEIRERIEAQKLREVKLKEENQKRREKRAEERRRAKESVEVKAEKKARAIMDQLVAERDDEVVFGDLAIRLVNREKFWKAYEDWVIKARRARVTEGATRHRLAVGPDADLRFEEDLETMEGYGEFWTEVKAIWTMEYTDYLYDRGGVWNTTVASLMLKPPIDELDDEYEPTRRNDQVGEFGNKKSKWERLWDANEGLPYWMNWESQESLWERPVICHVCDAAIPDDDVMCFKCKNARSEYNQRVYDELHPLEAEEEAKDAGEDDDDGTLLYLMKHVNRFAKAFLPKKKPKVEFSLPGSLADRLDRIPKVPNKHVVRLRRVWLGALRLVGIKKRPRRRPAPKKVKVLPAPAAIEPPRPASGSLVAPEELEARRVRPPPEVRQVEPRDFSILQDPRFVAAIVAVLLGQALAGWYVWREIQKEKHD
ncbi:hypothetical protein JL720_10629 [Aureococcus anophagefferens]|nr:hypothetical protein JL720_10629 [Aureococcus anophagefferens]